MSKFKYYFLIFTMFLLPSFAKRTLLCPNQCLAFSRRFLQWQLGAASGHFDDYQDGKSLPCEDRSQGKRVCASTPWRHASHSHPDPARKSPSISLNPCLQSAQRMPPHAHTPS